MLKVDHYSISYRPNEDAGSVHLALSDGSGADLPINSPAEATFLLQFLSQDEDVYYDSNHQLLTSGMEITGSDDEG